MKKFPRVLLLVCLLSLPFAAKADQFKEQILANEIRHDNFVTASQEVIIDGQVTGDVIVIGGTITINGPVTGDVIALGSIITINGPVSGNLRLVGEQITINSEIGKNVTLLANNFVLKPSAKINGTLAFAARQADLSGLVAKRIDAYGHNITLAGQAPLASIKISGNGQLKTVTGSQYGRLDYTAKDNNQLQNDTGAQIGQINFSVLNPGQDYSRQFAAVYFYSQIVGWFGLMILALALVSLFPKSSQELTATIVSQPKKNLANGALAIFITPLLILFLLITIIGVPLAGVLFGLYLLLIVIAKILTALTIGQYLLISLKQQLKSPLWAIIIGSLIFCLLIRTPLIGWLISLLAVIWSAGGIITWLRNKHEQNQF